MSLEIAIYLYSACWMTKLFFVLVVFIYVRKSIYVLNAYCSSLSLCILAALTGFRFLPLD